MWKKKKTHFKPTAKKQHKRRVLVYAVSFVLKFIEPSFFFIISLYTIQNTNTHIRTHNWRVFYIEITLNVVESCLLSAIHTNTDVYVIHATKTIDGTWNQQIVWCNAYAIMLKSNKLMKSEKKRLVTTCYDINECWKVVKVVIRYIANIFFIFTRFWAYCKVIKKFNKTGKNHRKMKYYYVEVMKKLHFSPFLI